MDEKERYKASILFGNVSDYDTGAVRYIAHWLWWVGEECRSLAIGDEMEDAGLEKNSMKHPDQKFWNQKKLVGRPHKSAIIVTDCKLLPCSKPSGCAYRVPFLIGKLVGPGMPIGVFCHSDYAGGEGPGKYGYYTESGATNVQIDTAMTKIFKWDWDDESDGETYVD